ncbi:hypothetical protein TWF718_005148 [Orbilia javanica]|uniref:Oxidoreductase acuF-like C2H2 type zinc-finger domain-containing protein n=1 Tax=Orbilia javanica TaxID=47235 RepID=A0AAN8RLJ5_9PEZI
MDELFQAHQSCRQKFANLVTLAGSPVRDFSAQVSRRDWDIEVERYRIWASGVGIGYTGEDYEKSLDYRLRDAAFMRSQVALILKLLIEHIENGKCNAMKPTKKRDSSPTIDPVTLFNAERVPWEDMAVLSAKSSAPERPNNDTQLSLEGPTDDTEEDSPWDFSSDDGSLNGDSPDDYMSGSEVAKKRTVNAIANVQGPHGRTRADSPVGEMAQIRHAIQTTISSLYGLPLQKAATQHRLRAELPEQVASFESLDISYVREKYPELAKFYPEVSTRLGKLITRRREILHSRKIRGLQEPHMDGTAALGPASQQQDPKNAPLVSVWPQPLSYSAPPQQAPISSLTDEVSEVTIQIPRRPLDENGGELEIFECPYCCKTTKIISEEEWRAHVLHDLQPYVCTYPNCDLGDFLFESRDQWFQHELAEHRVSWFCNIKGHDHFNNKGEFRRHMVAEHSNEFKVNEIDPLVASKLFSIPANATEPGLCTLCMNEVADPEAHVGGHLEILALSAISAEPFPSRPFGEGPWIEGKQKFKATEYGQSRGMDDEYSKKTNFSMSYLSGAGSMIPMANTIKKVFQHPEPYSKSKGETFPYPIPPGENKNFMTERGLEQGKTKKSRKLGTKIGISDGPGESDFLTGSDSSQSLGSNQNSRAIISSDNWSTSSNTDSDSDMAFGTPPRRETPESAYTTPSTSFSELGLKIKSWAKRKMSGGELPRRSSRRPHTPHPDDPSGGTRPGGKRARRRDSFDFNIAFGYSSSDKSSEDDARSKRSSYGGVFANPAALRHDDDEGKLEQGHRLSAAARMVPKRGRAAAHGDVKHRIRERSPARRHGGYAPPIPTARKRRPAKRESVDSNLAFGGSSSEESASDDVPKSFDKGLKKAWRWWTGTDVEEDIDTEGQRVLRSRPKVAGSS